jgi:hypothetical protein
MSIGASYANTDVTLVLETLDNYGNVSSKSETAARGYYNRKFRKVLDRNGNEVISTAHIRMHTKYGVTLQHRIKVAGTEYLILALEDSVGFSTDHVIVYLA